MDFEDYYEILGVTPNADKKAIQQAYRQLEAELTAQSASQQMRLARYREIYCEATWIELKFQE
jgi:DnaJ-class molecular chaperone